MIYMDKPRKIVFRGRTRHHTHLWSSVPDEKGSEELKMFAAWLGMNKRWLQNSGTPKEHYDLLSYQRIQQAIADGAVVVTTRDWAMQVRMKKGNCPIHNKLAHEMYDEGGNRLYSCSVCVNTNLKSPTAEELRHAGKALKAISDLSELVVAEREKWKEVNC